jgi:hypothetical protein
VGVRGNLGISIFFGGETDHPIAEIFHRVCMSAIPRMTLREFVVRPVRSQPYRERGLTIQNSNAPLQLLI